MVLSFLVILVVGLVAYFHYIQGFFSSAISVILTVISAVVAVAFHETLIISVLQGKVGEMAHSLSLVTLFAVTYLILRVIFDSLVPGNVQVPLMVDKIGAGVTGVIAGLFAGGIFAIAAQALPFGPSVAGFSRYELGETEDMSFSIPGPPNRNVDGKLYDPLKADKIDQTTPRSGLLVPADSVVLATTARLSNGGALAGAVPFGEVHPDYVGELFFQRLGIQFGGKRVAYNLPSAAQMQVAGLYTVSPLPQVDSENARIPYKARWTQPLATSVKADGGNILLIARISFQGDAADTDGNVRFSTSSVRLVVGGTNYLPDGTLDHGSTGPILRRNRPDDFLVAPNGGVIDLVYQVPAEALGVPSDMRSSQPWTVQNGFIEGKRMGGVSLVGMEIKRDDPGVPAQTAMLRKSDMPFPKGMTARVQTAATVQPGGAAPAAVAQASANPSGGPLDNITSRISSEFVSSINVGRYDGDVEDHRFGDSIASIKEGKFSKLDMKAGPPVRSVGPVEFAIKEMFVPLDHKLVQINALPATGEGTDPWEWATKLGQFTLVSTNGQTYQPNGAWAKVKQGANDAVVGRYDYREAVGDIAKSDSRPTDIWIVFVVPDGVPLQELRLGTTRLAAVNLTVN